ncbi:MAG: preprotein translocase subunit YajC [Ilumatobacteraceae bacterium]
MSMHLSNALLAQESGGGGGAAFLQLGILLLIPFAMYFFMIRPQRRRMREQQELQNSIEVGDEIVTTSGVYGTITGEDGPGRFWLEIDDDVQIRIARAAVQGKAAPDDDDDDETDDDAVDTAELESADDSTDD